MTADRSPFLSGALNWVYRGEVPPDACPDCGHEWASPPSDALDAIRRAPARYAELLDGRDGMTPASDGGWNATSYVWHLTDLARSWTERWVQLQSSPGSALAGWDPDVLADARNYRALPTAAALWALEESVSTFTTVCDVLAFDLTFEHGDWGRGTVADGIRWLAHEFVHHQLDVEERAAVSPGADHR
jgi:hypothetical protein